MRFGETALAGVRGLEEAQAPDSNFSTAACMSPPASHNAFRACDIGRQKVRLQELFTSEGRGSLTVRMPRGAAGG